MRLFITGVGSFIGRELFRIAQARGIACSGIDIVATGFDECTVADIRSTSVASLIPAGVDAIIHLAAMSRDADCRGKMQETLEINVSGALNMMTAGELRGVQQFIFASTEWVYGNFASEREKTEADIIDAGSLTGEYAFSKFMAENALRLAHLHASCAVTILRFGIVYGPRPDNWSAVESIVHDMVAGGDIAVGSLRTGRHFIHVTDIAEAILASVGRKDFEIFNIQGERLITLGDIIAETSRQLSYSPRVIERKPLTPSIRRVSGNHAALHLGWRPRISLSEGIASLIDYFSSDKA